MHLSFDNIEELQEFLNFVGYSKNETIMSVAEARMLAIAREPVHHARAEAALEADVGNVEPAETPAPVEKPKRTRKPKTETPATGAAVPSGDGSGTTSAEPAELASQNATAPANPFAAAGSSASTATQAILGAENQQQATLAGIAAMQTPPVKDSDDGADEAMDEAEPVKTELTAPEHMHLCRNFIAKHGQAKYMEAFALAGLSAAITGYTPEQRAQHAATLAVLEAQ